MSLINDALRRANQAQKQAPPVSPPASLQLRPVEPESEPQSGSSLFLPGLLALAAIIVVLLIIQLSRKSTPSEPVMTRARAAESANHAPEARPAAESGQGAASSDSLTRQAGSSPVVHAPLASPAQIAVNSPATTAPSPTNAVAVTPPLNSASPAPTNPPLPAVIPTPAAPPKLQGIVWDPRRPSAVINGRTLFVGDRFAEFRVRTISPDTVTLVSKTQTNLLQLEQ